MRKDDRKMEGERKVVSEMRVDEISRDKEFGGRGEREIQRDLKDLMDYYLDVIFVIGKCQH